MDFIYTTIPSEPAEVTLRDEAVAWATLQAMLIAIQRQKSVTNADVISAALMRIQATEATNALESFVASNYVASWDSNNEAVDKETNQ